MQRIVSLGLLAALLGGGWSYLQTVSPAGVQRVAQAVGGAVRQSGFGQQPTTPTGYPTGAYPSQQPTYTPYGQPVSPQPAAGFAPPPQPTRLPTIRIASFNIQTFGDAKAKKPHVMRAIAQIVRMFDVVAIQEIRTQDDYFIPRFLRDYVNAGGAAAYDARVSPRLGRTVSTEQYAFLFNTAKIDAVPGYSFVVPDPQDRLHREPHVALFQTRINPRDRAFTFALMNAHTDPDLVPEELDALYDFYRQVQRMSVGGANEDDVILLGDLNTAVPAAGPYTPNTRGRSIVPSDLRLLSTVPGISPLIRNQATNLRGTKLYDNLLIPSIATTEFTGSSGVIDVQRLFGISMEQAAEMSDHLPVWGEFSAMESSSLGSVAQRR